MGGEKQKGKGQREGLRAESWRTGVRSWPTRLGPAPAGPRAPQVRQTPHLSPEQAASQYTTTTGTPGTMELLQGANERTTKGLEENPIPTLPGCRPAGCRATANIPKPNPKPRPPPCSDRAAGGPYLWRHSAGGGAGRWWCWGLRAGWGAGCHSGWLRTSRSAGCWARSSSACPWPGRWRLWPGTQRWTAAGRS